MCLLKMGNARQAAGVLGKVKACADQLSGFLAKISNLLSDSSYHVTLSQVSYNLCLKETYQQIKWLHNNSTNRSLYLSTSKTLSLLPLTRIRLLIETTDRQRTPSPLSRLEYQGQNAL